MSRTRKSPAAKAASAPSIEDIIHTIRGERVIFDADLAKLYGVSTKALNQAVRRNRGKFPPDFVLQLTTAESITPMRSQFVTASKRNIRHQPFAFTEHGALMAANVLNSPQATQMSLFIVRAFIRMRGLLTDTRELASKLAALETELKARLDQHDVAITGILQRILLLLEPPAAPDTPDKEMGFHTTLAKSDRHER